MSTVAREREAIPEKKRRLISAAVRLMLGYGYNATTVDQICAEAGVTKGAFFHYFASKEEICRAAMQAWSRHWEEILLEAKFDAIEDPLDRLEHLFEVMNAAYGQPRPVTGCMVGTVALETSVMNRGIGDPAEAHLEAWVCRTRRLLDDAKAAHPPKADFDSESVAWFMCGIVQGSFLVDRVRQRHEGVLENVRHMRAYVMGLFGKTNEKLGGIDDQ